MTDLSAIFKTPAFANDNEKDDTVHTIGDLAKNIVARIANETVDKFKPLLASLTLLSNSDDFSFMHIDEEDSDVTTYKFIINNDPDAFLDIHVGMTEIFIFNPFESEILMGFNYEDFQIPNTTLVFDNNIDTFIYIKDFIEDNDPQFSSETVKKIAQARNYLSTLDDRQNQMPSLAYNHG